MTTRVVCPICRAANEVPDDLLGRKIRCRRCDEVIVARSDEVSEAPRRSRRRYDEDDEVPARRARRRRRPKGHLSPVAVFTATFAVLVILIAGIVGAYAVFSHSPPTQNNAEAPRAQDDPRMPPPVGGGEMFLAEKQPQYDAYFRAPEEPPHGQALEFAEPAPDGAGGPQPVRNNGPLTPEVLQKIKESTVFVAVQSAQGQGSGSGFFAGGPGLVVTNAHVVFMLNRSAPKPNSVKVVRNKGEKDEVTLKAEVLAVDHDADLAVLSVPKEGLPPPLLVKSALSLHETQPVYIAGFPLGERPGKNVTINEYKVSSLKKENGVLDKVQIHGEMVFGNSGGPVLDADGNVVAVCVSILPDPRVETHINFAVPGDKVLRFLNGHFADLTAEAPWRDGERLKVPVTVHVVDPLGRVSQAIVEYWVGPPGPARPGSRTEPKPDPKDGPHQTTTLAVKQQSGRGELTLPALKDGQVYWLQPSLVSPGGRVWMSAQVYQPPPPVDRKPARLAWAPAGEHSLVLERWSSLNYTDPGATEHHALLALELRLTESAKGRQGDDSALLRQFTGFKEGVSVGDQVHMTTRLQHVGPNIRFLADNVFTDAQGATKGTNYIPETMKDAPPLSKSQLMRFDGEMARFLQALDVPLPNKDVKPGETWKARRPLPLDGAWKTVDPFQGQAWTAVENESLEVTYTYSGLRTVKGTERAVIQIKGQVVPAAGAQSASNASLSGTAVVDLATGQIVEEEVTTKAYAELVAMNTTFAKAQGTVVARLRRE
jgi:S1-C subfamily serine protease